MLRYSAGLIADIGIVHWSKVWCSNGARFQKLANCSNFGKTCLKTQKGFQLSFCFFFNTSLSLGRNSGYITWYNTAAARAVLPILSCHREYILELPFLNWILVSSCSVCYYWPFPHPDEVMVTVDLTSHDYLSTFL